MNNKGQIGIGIITFIGVVIAILILAPIAVNIVTTIVGEVTTSINATDETAGEAMAEVQTDFTNLWDFAIVLVFALNVILLLLTAFLINTHPAFMLMYIMFAFFTIVFIPNIMDAVDKIYVEYSADVGLYLPLTEFLVDNFTIIILGIIILSGIIMYAKIKYSRDNF